MPDNNRTPVFRFAPSPNGELHIGHALSAILNHDMAAATGGRLLLRLEDIDTTRCTPQFEASILENMAWLQIGFEHPPRRQSDHFADYQKALEKLAAMGLVYPAFLTRGDVKAMVAAHEAEGGTWPRDPDGAPLYPDTDRNRSIEERTALLRGGAKHAWRLDMNRALSQAGQQLFWRETGDGARGHIAADPAAWGDVVLSRSDAPSSYHLSVVVDDALQQVSHVVRGLDLFHATSIHRLLQHLLDLPEPLYHHHRLIIGDDGRKLSKTTGSTGLAEMRRRGMTPSDIRRLIGIGS